MLKMDTIIKDYVKGISIFSEIPNYYIYGGRQVDSFHYCDHIFSARKNGMDCLV